MYEYIKLNVIDTIIVMQHIINRRIKNTITYDILDLREENKIHLRTLLRHYNTLPLITTYEDLKLIRKIGIRI